MRTRLLLTGVLACYAVAAPPSARRTTADEIPKAVAAPDLSGTWALNKALSDDARDKLREAMPRSPGPGSGSRPAMEPPPGGEVDDDGPAEAMRAILDPAEGLSIEQRPLEIVFEEEFGRQRTLRVDGRKRKADNGMSEITAGWRESRLVIETYAARGGKMRESWELSEGAKRLVWTIRLEGGPGGKVTITRVYDRSRRPPAQPEPDAPPTKPN